jgi:hypothetical protein
MENYLNLVEHVVVPLHATVVEYSVTVVVSNTILLRRRAEEGKEEDRKQKEKEGKTIGRD